MIDGAYRPRLARPSGADRAIHFSLAARRVPAVALARAIDDFLIELRVERGLSPLTIAAYRRDLAQFAEHATNDRWRTDPAPLSAFVKALQDGGAKGSTQARKSAAVRSFYAFALREGHATRDVPALVDAPKPGSYLPDVLAPDDVIRILDAPSADDPVGIKGIGEVGIVGAAAAVANAVWHATGVRHRNLPIRPDRVLEAGGPRV